MSALRALALGALLLGGCVPKAGEPRDAAPAADQTAVEQTADQAGGDETVAGQGAADQTASDQTASDQAASDQAAQSEAAPATEPPAPDVAALLPLPGSAPAAGGGPTGLPGSRTPVPHIYVSLQSQGPGHPVSAVFAIDAARDATPSDDPAIRITPDGGLCNPQAMTNYNFPDRDADRPVVTEADRARGLSGANLPSFMAVVVTERMLAEGLAAKPEDTAALNICTRKLWEQLVAAENPEVASGQ